MSEDRELVEMCRFHRVDAKNCHECRKVEPQTVLTEAGMERAAREIAGMADEDYSRAAIRFRTTTPASVLATMKKHAGGGE